MADPNVVTTQNKAYHLDPTINGYYREIQIQNCMTVPIAIINQQGQRIILPPQNNFGGRGVLVTIRHADGGSRVDRTGSEICIDTVTTSIPDWKLMQEPVYHQDANVIICTMNFVDVAQHPARIRVYEDAKRELLQQMAQQGRMLTMTVLANDPAKEVTRLYVHIFGKDLVVPVTHHPANEATVYFMFSSHGKEVHRCSVPMKEVIDGPGYLDTASGFILHIAHDLDKLKASLKAYVDRERLTREGVDKNLAEMTAEHKEELQRLRRQHDAELQAKGIETAGLTNQLKETKLEVDRLTAQNQEWAGITAARVSIGTSNAKEHENTVKVQTADLGYRSEQLKYESLVWKTVGAVAIAAVTWFVKGQLDKRRG